MSAAISGAFGAGTQFFTNAGVVLSGGLLNTYLAGTTTAQATWTDSTQATQNANPIVLNSAGRLPNEIWLASATSYKFVLTDSAGNTLGTWDNIPGINSAIATSEWTAGTTPTYISASSFSLSGNVVGTYQVNRRVQYTVTAGTYYGTITSSVYNGSTLTTIGITADSTGLDSSLSAVSYGFLSATNYSIPAIYPYTTAANSWTAAQTFTNSDIRLLGSSTGYTTFTSANAGASNYTLTFPAVTDTLATLGTAQTFSATQTLNGTSSAEALALTNAAELVNIVAAAPSATTNFYLASGAVQYYTTSAANNWTLNFAMSAGTSANTAMAIGDSVTIALLTTQGATAYYESAMTIDGGSVTPKWQGGTAPAAGNASGIDVYTYTIVKTAGATFTVLAALAQFK